MRYLLGNASEAAIHSGDWAWALEQLRDVAEEDDEPAERISFGASEAIIQAARGQRVDEQVAALRELAAGFDDLQYIGTATDAAIAAAMAAGRYSEVLELARDPMQSQLAVDATTSPAARAALRLRDADLLRQLLQAYQPARKGRRTAAVRKTIEAGVAGLEGGRSEARTLYLEALQAYRELNLRWIVALTGLDAIFSDVLEPAERQRVADEARAILEKLLARPYLAQLDALLAEAPASRSPAAARTEAISDEVPSG